MATKETLKKFCKSTGRNRSSCRLYKAVLDSNYCNNLYSSSIHSILKNAEEIYCNVLPQDENFPHLICRPCERRLGNAMQFKRIVVETQQLLVQACRTKCCVEISPSIIKPSRKVCAIDGSSSGRRRGLDFNEADTQALQPLQAAVVTTSVPLEVSSVLYSYSIIYYKAENTRCYNFENNVTMHKRPKSLYLPSHVCYICSFVLCLIGSEFTSF